jgi:hypothetical protein
MKNTNLDIIDWNLIGESFNLNFSRSVVILEILSCKLLQIHIRKLPTEK